MTDSTNPSRKAFTALLLILMLAESCRDDHFQLNLIQFAVVDQSMIEGDSLTVLLAIEGQIDQDDSLFVSVIQQVVSVATNPPIRNNRIAIPLKKGQTTAEFQIKAIDNSALDGDRQVGFRLSDPGLKFRVGAHAELRLQVRDDEAVSRAQFSVTKDTIHEGQSGRVVQILLSNPLKEEGTGEIVIRMSSTSASYGVNYTTIPAAINNGLTLKLGPDDAEASFIITVNDDDELHEGVVIHLSIEAVYGSIGKGTNLELEVAVLDNEIPSHLGFQSPNLTVNEDDAGGVIIDIILDSPASGPGSFSVGIEEQYNEPNGYGSRFITDPPAVNSTISFVVVKGDSHFAFKVLPIIDAYCATTVVTFFLSSSNGTIKLGGPLETIAAVRIYDSNATEAKFGQASGTIGENDGSGLFVQIPFSRTALAGDAIRVDVPEGYGTRFLTYPPMQADDYVGSWVIIPVAANASSVGLMIYPINNSLKGDFEVTFSIYPKIWGCVLVSEGQIFRLTILDDD